MKINKVGTALTVEEIEIINHIVAGRSILLNVDVQGDVTIRKGALLSNGSVSGNIKITSKL